MSDDLGMWTDRAKCRLSDSDSLFADGADQSAAKSVCHACPVRTECLAHALDHRIEHGIWGGMTERERRALLRRRPGVTSWRRLLDHARIDYERTADCLILAEDEIAARKMSGEAP
ncbi:WhiB family transcriptional regulator [Streptomyces sp. NPDC058417]|uniref:WhiB family transcriptional regulator n=1 Tax=unclassified Streptomyces TaxID=2593676 RepID=UPI0036600619